MVFETARLRRPRAVLAPSSVSRSFAPQDQLVMGISDTNLCCQMTGDKD
jgi:hypothetical protein